MTEYGARSGRMCFVISIYGGELMSQSSANMREISQLSKDGKDYGLSYGQLVRQLSEVVPIKKTPTVRRCVVCGGVNYRSTDTCCKSCYQRKRNASRKTVKGRRQGVPVEMDKQLFVSLYNAEKNDRQVAKAMGVSLTYINKYRKRNKLPANGRKQLERVVLTVDMLD